MYSSPKLVGYAAFSGLHFAAQRFSNTIEETDFEDRLRIHLAAYCLGTAIVSHYVAQTRAWPADEFLDQFTSGMVNSPGFFDGESSLGEVIVHTAELDKFRSFFSRHSEQNDSIVQEKKTRESRNLYHVLCLVRNRTFVEALSGSDAGKLFDVDSMIRAGLFCTSSWLWGAAPTNVESQRIGILFFTDVSDWTLKHILPILESEEE